MPSGPSRQLLAADTREHGGVLKEHGYVTDRGWSGRGAAGAGRGGGAGRGRGIQDLGLRSLLSYIQCLLSFDSREWDEKERGGKKASERTFL